MSRSLLPLLALVPSLAMGQAAPLTPKQVYDRCRDSVVSIEVESPEGKVTGTGFFYEDGRTVATALHVIDHAKSITIRARGGDSWAPVSVSFDVSADTAVLRLGADSGRLGIAHAPSDSVSVGDPIYVIGDPLGLTGSLSTGVVGALRENDGVPLVQITASISHGSSGGPVLDGRGRVLGIVSFSFTEGQNLNMAVGTKVAKGLAASKDAYTMAQLSDFYRRVDEKAAKTPTAKPAETPPDSAPSSTSATRMIARARLSAKLGQVFGDLYAADERWTVLWQELLDSEFSASADRFYEAKRALLGASVDAKAFEAMLALAREGGVDRADLTVISDRLGSVERIAGERCEAMVACKIAALGRSESALRDANQRNQTQRRRLSDSIREFHKAVRGFAWCDSSVYDGAVSASVKAAWILVRFSASPDFDLPTAASVRYADRSSDLRAGDRIEAVSLDEDGAEFEAVEDWGGFYDFCEKNVKDGKAHYKLRVRRGGSTVVVREVRG